MTPLPATPHAVPVFPSIIRFFTILLAVGSCLSVFAKDKSGEEVEVKCLLPANKIAELYQKLGLASKPPLRRVVCFFDTSSLALFKHKPVVILRSRYDPSPETDTTVKVRGGTIKPDAAKCEFDKVIGKDRVKSCSVTNEKQPQEQIEKANAGKDAQKIFSGKQETAIKIAFGKLDWQTLQPYGPVRNVKVWKKIPVPGGPPLTVERWDLPARPNKPARVIVEVSAKVPLAKEAETSRWIARFLGVPENGAGQESETKTKIVLEHFAPKAR
jgi:hypothetical protein